MKKNKLFLNSIASITNQIVVLFCGFILPRLIIVTYGSAINGLISSLNQFLNVIAFMQLGVGAVVQSALYKPLANNLNEEVSAIFISAQRFFRLIALIFLVYVAGLVFVYPLITNSVFDIKFCGSLIVILAINMFAQYFFGLTNQMLLYADQKAYIPLIIDTVSVLVNTIIAIVVMKAGASIQTVKMISTMIFVIRPVLLTIYVRNNYKINYKKKIYGEPIKQKWNGFAQHLASTVMDNTDAIILTTFSTLESVSVYYIYNLVTFGLRQLVTSLTVGVQSLFGNLFARLNINEVKQRFEIAEFAFHILSTFLFSCALVLILPFVSVYTKGITDATYIQPVFSGIIVMAQCVYCYRLVYYIMIKAAGHYKETQNSAVGEMLINLSLSIVLVIKFGLIGVAIGTLVATIYRTIYFVWYLSKNILKINVKKTLVCFVADAIAIIICYFVCENFHMLEGSYFAWFILAVKVAIICLIVIIAVFISINAVFNRNLLNRIFSIIFNKNWEEE